jgi:hypothetical protein
MANSRDQKFYSTHAAAIKVIIDRTLSNMSPLDRLILLNPNNNDRKVLDSIHDRLDSHDIILLQKALTASYQANPLVFKNIYKEAFKQSADYIIGAFSTIIFARGIYNIAHPGNINYIIVVQLLLMMALERWADHLKSIGDAPAGQIAPKSYIDQAGESLHNLGAASYGVLKSNLLFFSQYTGGTKYFANAQPARGTLSEILQVGISHLRAGQRYASG